MASLVSPLASASSSSASTSSTANSSSQPNEQMFLQLLVSQLQNQDPMNPADSTQFVSELAQFSELEQVIGIRGDIESYHAAATAAASSTSATQTDGTNQSGTNGTTET